MEIDFMWIWCNVVQNMTERSYKGKFIMNDVVDEQRSVITM